MRVGILGGTGPAGKALAVRLASVGVRVTIGSRSLDRAADACTELTSAWPSYRLDLLPGDNDDAASGDLVVVATPWDGAGPTARTLAARLEDKVVVSMANALIKVGREFQPLMPPRGSVAAEVAAQVPRALVAAAFHHLPARELGSIDHPMDGDVLICSDHPQAVTAVADLVRLIPGLRPLDAGSLAAAAPIEAMTAVILSLNLRYKTRAALSMTGIPDQTESPTYPSTAPENREPALNSLPSDMPELADPPGGHAPV